MGKGVARWQVACSLADRAPALRPSHAGHSRQPDGCCVAVAAIDHEQRRPWRSAHQGSPSGVHQKGTNLVANRRVEHECPRRSRRAGGISSERAGRVRLRGAEDARPHCKILIIDNSRECIRTKISSQPVKRVHSECPVGLCFRICIGDDPTNI